MPKLLFRKSEQKMSKKISEEKKLSKNKNFE